MILAIRHNLAWRSIMGASILAFLLPSWLFLILSDETTATYFSTLCFFVYACVAMLLFGRAAYFTRQYQPGLYRAWLLLTLAIVVIPLVVVAHAFVEIVLEEHVDIITGAALLLTSHFLLACGVYCFPQNRQRRLQSIRQTIDLATVLIGSSLLLWVLWINPLLAYAQLDVNAILVTTLYLSSDLVLIAALISLLFRSQLFQPRGPLGLLSASIFVMLLADLNLGLQTDARVHQAGGITDHLYLAALILGAAAATLQAHEIKAPLSPAQPTKRVARLIGGTRIALPPFLLFVTYVVMIFTHVNGTVYASYLMAGGIGVMFVLVSVHQLLTLLENVDLTFALRTELAERRQAQDELLQVNVALEHHVVERTKELLLLNEQLRDNEQKLRFDAFHDKLTSLPNRAAFIQHLESALQAFRADGTYRFAVLFLDFDSFKVVNDSLGHWLGDEFLVALARRLKEQIPIGNLAARLGGDEFVVLIEHILDEQEVLEIAERLQSELRRPFEIRGYRLYTTASIGVVMNNQLHQSAGDLLRDADIAMYRAKENGKACCVVFDATMRAQAVARLKLETALRNALTRNELTLAYQPIWNVAAHRVTGFEALARWHHAEFGAVSPAEFIPIAEETGLIIPLGEWVLQEACRQLKQWQACWPQASAMTVSVNISAHQLYQGDFVTVVQRILQTAGLPASALNLEITESVLMADIDAAIDACTQLQALGVSLQIDDFGTGYSSFNYLHRLPINTMKIDKSFIDLLELGGQHVEIVRTIATLAHNLQLSVIAEGVETQAQLQYVEALGCEEVQGYLISKPLDSDAIECLINSVLVDDLASSAKILPRTNNSKLPPPSPHWLRSACNIVQNL